MKSIEERREEGRKGKGSRHIRWNAQPHPRQLMLSRGRKRRVENRREHKERNRERVTNTATLDHSVPFYDVKKRKGIEAQRVKPPTLMLS